MSRRIGLRTAIAAVLALIVAPWFAASASADQATPLPPATGDLVIHKYVGAPVGGSATGYQVDTSGWTGVAPAAGVSFDLYQVGAPVDPAVWPAVPPQGTYVRNSANGKLEVFQGTTLIGRYYLQSAATPTVTTGAGGVGAAAGLPQGLYLVVENVAASTSITNADTGESLSISRATAPFLVAVPMTAPDGSGWLDVVHVYPKNEPLTVTKTVEGGGAVMVGDKVTYTITVSIPSSIVGSSIFVITDKFHDALDLDESSVVVDTLPALREPDALIQGADYDIVYTKSRALGISFWEKSYGKLAQASSVVVTFDVFVNKALLQAPSLTVPNTASVEFVDPDNQLFHGESDGDATIWSAAIRVTKVDQAGQALNGASFKIASTQANAKAGNFFRLDQKTKVLYDFDPAPTSYWATLGAANDYTISPSSTAEFVGLRDRADVDGTLVWQTYWVVETAAPAGYNLLPDPIEVSFENAFNQFADPANYDRVALLTVTNSKGFILPVTGGAGTIWLTVTGIVLIGVAVLVAVTRKKPESSEPTVD